MPAIRAATPGGMRVCGSAQEAPAWSLWPETFLADPSLTSSAPFWKLFGCSLEQTPLGPATSAGTQLLCLMPHHHLVASRHMSVGLSAESDFSRAGAQLWCLMLLHLLGPRRSPGHPCCWQPAAPQRCPPPKAGTQTADQVQPRADLHLPWTPESLSLPSQQGRALASCAAGVTGFFHGP